MGLINKLLDKVLSKLMDKYLEKNMDTLLTAVQKVNEGGDVEDIDTIVDDYFYLLKSVYRKGKPHHVSVNREDSYILIVDGVEYDFDLLIHHNDQKNTERRMEIEVLFSDNIPTNEVQKRLNQKIENEW